MNMDDQRERRRFLKYLFSLLAFAAGSISPFGKNNDLRTKRIGTMNIGHLEAQAMGVTVTKMKKIAVEEHFTTEKICNYVTARVEAGAKFNLGITSRVSDHAKSLVGDKRIKDMDEAGIDKQVISPVCFHEGFVDPSEGTAAAKVTNDECHEIVRRYPNRFIGFAGLACHDPDGAAKELERAVKDLGLKGAMIYSHIQGEYLDDQKFWVIFEMAEKLGVPIFLHPKDPSPDMSKVYTTNECARLDYAHEAGLHAMRLIASGLFDKYPGLQIILGHGGEGLPFWLWRMGMGSDDGQTLEEGVSAFGPPSNGGLLCKKQPGQYVKENFYAATSDMFWVPVLEFLHKAMGPDRVLFAVDYPTESNILAVKSIESMSVSNEDKEKIFHFNIERLLKL